MLLEVRGCHRRSQGLDEHLLWYSILSRKHYRIYTEKVGDNSVRISYYNPCGDVEDSAETFLTKPCVFYIGPRTNIYIDDNIKSWEERIKEPD